MRGFKPSLPMAWVLEQLGFRAPRGRARPKPLAQPLPGCQFTQLTGKHAPAETDAAALAACIEWAQQHGAVVTDAAGAPRRADRALSLLARAQRSPQRGRPQPRPHTRVRRSPLTLAASPLAPAAAGPAASLDCKASGGKLFVPEDNTKVAHGDANLAIEDFLARAMV